MPAARMTDLHLCPEFILLVPHAGGPTMAGEPTVLAGKLPQAPATDMAQCVGPPDPIAMGSTTVMVGGLPAARLGDACAHGGAIVLGCFTMLIG